MNGYSHVFHTFSSPDAGVLSEGQGMSRMRERVNGRKSEKRACVKTGIPLRGGIYPRFTMGEEKRLHTFWRDRMTDEEIAALFLASGFVWGRHRDMAIAVRVARLTEAQAVELKRRFRGSAAPWPADGTWSWETGGKRAIDFLITVSEWVRLVPQEREQE